MAVAPLFVSDALVLRKALRLSGVSFDSDTMSVIEEAMISAKATFYRKLGRARVTELLTYTFADPPTTDQQVLRMVANSTEQMLVRRYLLHTIPTLFAAGGAAAKQIWNDEAPFIESSSLGTRRAIEALDLEIEESFSLLAASHSLGEESSVKCATIEPDCTPPRPFGTVGL